MKQFNIALYKNAFQSDAFLCVLISIHAIFTMVFYFPAAPLIVKDLNIADWIGKQAINAYIIGQALLPLVFGHYADNIGFKKSIIFIMLFFIFSCLTIVFIPSATSLLTLRFLQGGLTQSSIVISRALISKNLNYSQTVKFFAWLALVQSIAYVVGAQISGYTLEYFPWKSIFFLLIGISIIITLTALALEGNKKNKKNKKDKKVFSKNTIIKFKYKNIKKILHSKQFSVYTIISALLNACTIFFFTAAPFYFISYLNISPELFGAYMSFMTSGFMLGSFLLPRISHKFCNNKLLYWNLLICLISGFIMLAGYYQECTYILFAQFLYAFSKALAMPILQTRALNACRKQRILSSAMFNFISTIISVAGVWLGTLYEGNMVIFCSSLFIILSLTFSIIIYHFLPKVKDKLK